MPWPSPVAAGLPRFSPPSPGEWEPLLTDEKDQWPLLSRQESAVRSASNLRKPETDEGSVHAGLLQCVPHHHTHRHLIPIRSYCEGSDVSTSSLVLAPHPRSRFYPAQRALVACFALHTTRC